MVMMVLKFTIICTIDYYLANQKWSFQFHLSHDTIYRSGPKIQ